VLDAQPTKRVTELQSTGAATNDDESIAAWGIRLFA
jgi:hypothetical protein